MRSGIAMLVLLFPGLAAAGERLDWWGDPLPLGAVARLGSLRFRDVAAPKVVAWSHDGKFVAACDDRRVVVWDAATGKQRASFAAFANLPAVRALAFAPDGRHLAVALDREGAHVWEIATGKVRTVAGHATFVAFAADGKSLHVGGPQRLARYALGNLKVLSEWSLEGDLPAGASGEMALSPDGKTLAASPGGGGPLVLLDTATSKTRELADLHGVPAFAPDGRTLAVVQTKEATLFDVAGERVVARWPLPAEAREKHPPVFAPDGKVLAAGGFSWSVPDGKALGPLPTEGYGIAHLAFAPDGRSVVLCGSRAPAPIEIWDAARPCRRVCVDAHTAALVAAAFSPTGKLVATCADDATVRVHETTTGRPLLRIPLSGGPCTQLSFAPDEKRLAGLGADGVVLWDLVTGEPIGEVACSAVAVAFTSDGRELVAVGVDGQLSIRDASTGREHRRDQAGETPLLAAAFSADATLLAVQSGNELRLWDVTAGKKRATLERLPLQGGRPGALLFSADGAYLLAGSGLWDTQTGRRLARAFSDREHPLVEGRKLALSPDGRLVLGIAYADRAGLWEVASGRERLPLPHLNATLGAYAPDGRSVLVADTTPTALVWETRSRAGVPPDRLADLWEALTGDAPLAGQAVGDLREAGAAAVTLLDGHLQPARVGKADIERLIDRLDHDDFDVREQASADLTRLGPVAREALEETVRTSSKPEAVQRARRILEALAGPPPGTILRVVRAVEVLEGIGTAEARTVLRRLAGGAEGTPETDHARAALRRLGG